MTLERYGVVVVGASVAAEAFTSRLLELGHEEEILVVDRDARMPYERPPLSKSFLTRPDDTEISVDWDEGVQILCAEATGLDPEARTITFVTADEDVRRSVEFGTLVIATGATPFRLPIEPEGVLRLRTVADAEHIRESVGEGSRVGIIGAGAIGAELATSLREVGADVTVLDKADRPLERLLVGHLGADVTSWLQARGIQCRWSVDIASIEGPPGDWTVMLGDGEVLGFDVLISAVGARPVVAWLDGSGVLSDGQLLCSVQGQVLSPRGPLTNVYGIGDVVTRQLETGNRVRTESWTAAAEDGAQLAELLTGRAPQEDEPPYFWTDVAGRKIQVFGTLSREGEIEVEFENPARGSIVYKVSGQGGEVGWIGINAGPKIAMLRLNK